MLMPTSPLARLGTFRIELHACFARRADALLELGDALLCAPAITSVARLSLEPAHRRGWAASMMRWPVGASTSTGGATCWSPPCPTPTSWCSRSM
jgi:hypothetical protein